MNRQRTCLAYLLAFLASVTAWVLFEWLGNAGATWWTASLGLSGLVIVTYLVALLRVHRLLVGPVTSIKLAIKMGLWLIFPVMLVIMMVFPAVLIRFAATGGVD